MIILKLRGSLGNQLFSYAFARSLCIQRGDTLLIDPSPMYRYKAQSYLNLDKYNIKGIFVNGYITDKIRVFLTKRNIVKFKTFNTVEDTRLYIQEIVDDIPNHKNIVLDGHWQSYRYFEDNWNTISTELTLKKKYSIASSEIANEITHTQSVAIHIRRGDYLNNNHQYGNSGFTNLPKEYYLNAVEYIRSKVKNPTFYIFSDDIQWVKENIHIDSAKYMTANLELPYNDPELMSLCKHNIIANSTFSWWGAYMNQNIDKIVIAPNSWFSDEQRNKKQLNYLIPKEWIRM